MENKEEPCECGACGGSVCGSETRTVNTSYLLKWDTEEDKKTIYLVAVGSLCRPASPQDVEAIEKAFRDSLNTANEVGLAVPHACRIETFQVSTLSRTVFKLGCDERPVSADEIKDFQDRFAKAVATDGILVTGLPVSVDKFYVESRKCQKS